MHFADLHVFSFRFSVVDIAVFSSSLDLVNILRTQEKLLNQTSRQQMLSHLMSLWRLTFLKHINIHLQLLKHTNMLK